MDINQMVWQTTLAVRRSAVVSAPNVCFFARKRKPTVAEEEESLLGFSNSELRSINKKDLDEDLDEDVYDMKRKLGRLPKAGEYVIRVSLAKGDVRIIDSLSEKRQWDSESLAPTYMVFKKYRAVLDPDGIHARVELDSNALLVKRCPNCLKLVPIDDIDVAMSGKAVFCCLKCKQEYARRKHLSDEQIEQVRQGMDEKAKQRIHEIEAMVRSIA